MIGKPDDMVFMPDRDYTFCRICGAIYQPELNRTPLSLYTDAIKLAAELLRREWSHNHAKTHSATEHRQLHLSGRALTPDAQLRLAPYGVLSISDMGLDEESAAAGRQAPRMPLDDVEV